jgi:hypothetical protein
VLESVDVLNDPPLLVIGLFDEKAVVLDLSQEQGWRQTHDPAHDKQ